MSVAFVAALLSCLLLASSAFAGQPSTVTVRVVGLTGTTLLPQTSVTTTSTPIEPEPPESCSGTSAGGALYDAVHGNWVVKYESLGYGIDGIQGLNFPPFSSTSPPDAYWSFWLNGAPATEGACGQELESGDDVVFFAQCIAVGTDCPTSDDSPQHFLTVAAPASSSVQVGTPVAVTVGSLNTESGANESLPSGVTVNAGSINATPNAQGVATLTFPSVGAYTIEATAPNSVPSDPHTVCVHNGNDGTCGTTVEAVAKGIVLDKAPGVSVQPVDVATAGGVENGRHYGRRKGPRTLSGLVQVPTGGTLREVRISLQRRNGKRCTVFSGAKEMFVRAHCGATRFFSVSGAESFSYLLPASLPPGRYVYDIEAINGDGQTTKLVAGVSHVVFYVK
ncbi:MAG: DUF4430 domain-containing protein [Solirubrobacteraceae bacterium]